MNRGETLAREPSLQLILYSFLVAVAFNLLPWPPHLPLPDAVAALLVFWAAQAPRKMGLGLAWVLGLVMDAHSGVLLGEHALIYSLPTYGAVSLHRRSGRPDGRLWASIRGKRTPTPRRLAPADRAKKSPGAFVPGLLGWPA